MKERVLIATNEPMLAKGLEATLVAGGLDVCAMCGDVFELFECFLNSRPDIVILDLPVLPGPEVIRELRRLAPKCQLLLWPRPIPSRGVEEALRYGARGVLPADAGISRLVELLHMITDFPEPQAGPAELVNRTCSAQERKCLAMAGHGLSNQEIAAAMGSDEPTVHKLLRTVSHRLGVEDRYELALYGLSTLTALDSHQQGEDHG